MGTLRTAVLAIGLLSPSNVSAQEYFGKFRDTLNGQFIPAQPRPKFKLANKFRFVDPNNLEWEVPANTAVDGASIPQIFWSFIGGPFEGEYINASVIHDHYCVTKERTEHDTHRDFYYGMRASGVAEWKAKFMYWAVATFGPKWSLQPQMFAELQCSNIGVTMACRQVPSVRISIVSLPAPALDDPNILAAALSKASTVARALKTTEGRILDISASGEVNASLDDITGSATQYRSLIGDKEFLKDPGKLGVLSEWQGSGLDNVVAFPDKKLPRFDETTMLRPAAIESIQSGRSFKLDVESLGLLQGRINLKAVEIKGGKSQ